MTIDLEDWFHLLDCDETVSPREWTKFEKRIHIGLEPLLVLLEKREITATFFILGWIADQYPDIVKEIKFRGHEIGCHSYHHPLLYTLDFDEFYRDTDRALLSIEKACGRIPDLYRAPGFSLTNSNLWVLEALSEFGISIDCSIFPTARAHGGIKNYPEQLPHRIKLRNGNTIVELPMSYKNVFGKEIVFSGGGYFRLMPYCLIKWLFNSSPYNMTYFHPRDFDAGQPVIPNLSKWKLFKSYVGLAHSFDKLEKLTNDFEFCSVSEYVNQTEIRSSRSIV